MAQRRPVQSTAVAQWLPTYRAGRHSVGARHGTNRRRRAGCLSESNMQPVVQPTAHNMQHAAHNTQHTTCSGATCGTQRTTYNLQHTTRTIQHPRCHASSVQDKERLIDMQFALRVCREHQKWNACAPIAPVLPHVACARMLRVAPRCHWACALRGGRCEGQDLRTARRRCVHIYSQLSLHEEAVDLALKIDDVDLAKIHADKPEDDDACVTHRCADDSSVPGGAGWGGVGRGGAGRGGEGRGGEGRGGGEGVANGRPELICCIKNGDSGTRAQMLEWAQCAQVLVQIGLVRCRCGGAEPGPGIQQE